MASIYDLKNRTKTESRDSLPDIYKQARDLEVRSLAERVINQAGRDASPEYLHEIAIAIAEAAQKKGGR
jgi:hypothetical protein